MHFVIESCMLSNLHASRRYGSILTAAAAQTLDQSIGPPNSWAPQYTEQCVTASVLHSVACLDAKHAGHAHDQNYHDQEGLTELMFIAETW